MCVFQDSELVPSILVSTAHVINIFPAGVFAEKICIIPPWARSRERSSRWAQDPELPDFVPHGHCHSY